MDANFSAIDIADFFVQLVNSIPEDSIDNLKINKLLYFAQAHSLVTLDRPIFSDAIEAWEYGPVVPSVYHAFKCCGSNPISEPNEVFDESRLSVEELNVLTDVYMHYGPYTGIALKNLSHMPGSPWRTCFVQGNNNVIPNSLIKEYFSHLSDSGFELNPDPALYISAVPSSWDSEEDNIYG